jgi:hypothetical protein
MPPVRVRARHGAAQVAPTVNISLSFQTQKYMTALPDDELRAVRASPT